MKFFALSAGVMLAGLSLQLGMVIRLIEPALSLSLIGYASFFAGMLLALLGALNLAARRR